MEGTVTITIQQFDRFRLLEENQDKISVCQSYIYGTGEIKSSYQYKGKDEVIQMVCEKNDLLTKEIAQTKEEINSTKGELNTLRFERFIESDNIDNSLKSRLYFLF